MLGGVDGNCNVRITSSDLLRFIFNKVQNTNRSKLEKCNVLIVVLKLLELTDEHGDKLTDIQIEQIANEVLGG